MLRAIRTYPPTSSIDCKRKNNQESRMIYDILWINIPCINVYLHYHNIVAKADFESCRYRWTDSIFKELAKCLTSNLPAQYLRTKCCFWVPLITSAQCSQPCCYTAGVEAKLQPDGYKHDESSVTMNSLYWFSLSALICDKSSAACKDPGHRFFGPPKR